MDLAGVHATFNAAQAVLATLGALHLTADLWPPNAHVPDGSVYDYIVVGGGTAGCVVASRLSEHPENRVLLIEAGGDPPVESVLPGLIAFLPHSKTDWNYKSTKGFAGQCHKHHRLAIISGRMLGGCSSNYFMEYIRGNKQDYDDYARILGDPSWSWDSIQPYFKKAERLEDPGLLSAQTVDYYGTKGNLGLTRQKYKELEKYLEAFREVGHDTLLDVNGGNNLGYTQAPFTISEGIRQSTAYGYLTPAAKRRNLHVLKNTLVSRVIFEDNQAVGVEAVTKNKKTITVRARKEVILSAGAFQTPKILMLSGIGPADHLNDFNIPVIADLPVGHNLQDHVGTTLFFKYKGFNLVQAAELFNPFHFPVPFMTGFAALDKNQTVPDYQNEFLVLETGTPTASIFCSIVLEYSDDICKKVNAANRKEKIILVLLNHLHPKSRGRVSLRSKNVEDAPVIDVGFYSNKKDLDDMVEYIKDFVRITNSTVFKKGHAKLLEFDKCKYEDSDSYWRCYASCVTATNYHYVGSAAMGSVVDKKLRVLGVKGLRVADASVIPHMPSGNTLAAVMVVAEKAADMILNDDA